MFQLSWSAKKGEKTTEHYQKSSQHMTFCIRKGRTWAIAVRRGSYKSLFLLNLGRFPQIKIGKFSSELCFEQNGLNRYGPSSNSSPGVTRIGSLPSQNPADPRRALQRPRRTLEETRADAPEKSRTRKFPQRASRRVVPPDGDPPEL